jgi:DNA-binding transcriptional LysR family regulator
MDLPALADFNLVARHGGFGKAARASGRPKATLSRRVSELESRLEIRLFERGGRDLKLTEEGRALHARTTSLLAELDDAAATISAGGHKPRGKLRISAPLLFSQTAIGKLAAGFAAKYPDVRLEVTTEDRVVDMVEEGYDLVIRVNPNPDASLVGRAFLHDRLVVVGSPSLRGQTGRAPVPAVVRGPASQEPAWTMMKGSRKRTIAVDPVLQLSSLVMVRDAVRAGAGIAQLPVSLVSLDIADGSLAHWGDIAGLEIALWALYPSRRLLSVRVSAFLEFLALSFPTGAPDELAAFIGK